MRQLKSSIKARLKGFILTVLYDEVDNLVIVSQQVRDFYDSPENQRQRYYEQTHDVADLSQRLIQAGVLLEDAIIDVEDFSIWLHNFRAIHDYYQPAGDACIEKCLEHYLAYRWLKLSIKDTYIDVAADKSPWAMILRERNIQGYRLDLSYPSGIHGYDIGADAGNTGLESEFASALSLQCAYETFQGDSDIRFITEAERILSPGGNLAILPLYIDSSYFILSSPYIALTQIQIDEGAIRVWREDKFREPYSRHYSPEAFAKRVYSQLQKMHGKIIRFTNLQDVRDRYPGQRIYCDFMFFCEKPV